MMAQLALNWGEMDVVERVVAIFMTTTMTATLVTVCWLWLHKLH